MTKRYSEIILAVFMVCMVTVLVSCSDQATTEEKGQKKEAQKTETDRKMSEHEQAVRAIKDEPGSYVVFDTTMGRIICELFPEVAPEGVANFVGLTEGTKEFIDPATGKKTKRNLYDGLVFHRVIPGFMIQGGDPAGNGTGGPGYIFKNETSRDVLFDRPGRLAYANRGPDTNGSQFFITHNATPHLNGGYTIFGHCIEGQDVVNKIGGVKANPRNNMPETPVVMEKVTIVRIEEQQGE